MEDVLELLDFVADIGFEGVLTWILRLIGLLLIIAGVVAYVVLEMGLLVSGGLVVGASCCFSHRRSSSWLPSSLD